MAKGRELKSYGDFQRAIRQGFGQGSGTDYKPWLRVNDVKSKGLSTKIKGITSHRTHQFVSSIETQFFYFADHEPGVIDIREQFPLLPLNLSIRIASELGIKHPRVPGTSVENVMTTDFLLTVLTSSGERYLAVSAKPRDKLCDKRTMEKQEIERQWWSILGVPFRVFCGDDNTSIQARNLADISAPCRRGYSLKPQLVDRASKVITTGIFRLDQCIDRLKKQCGITTNQARNLLLSLIHAGYLVVPLESPIIENGVVKIVDTRFKKQANAYSA